MKEGVGIPCRWPADLVSQPLLLESTATYVNVAT
jgi:hypothetical protein